MNDQSAMFHKLNHATKHINHSMEKAGHFIANKNNHLERSVRNSKEEQGPIYK